MNIKKTIEALKSNRFTVQYFETMQEAADYLNTEIDGKCVGFGDSITIKKMNLYQRLSTHNTVYDPNQSKDNDEFIDIARKCFNTEIFLTSVNAVSETGEMINIDGTGNCNSPDRICNSMNIYMKKMDDTEDMEIVLINEELGF